MLTKIKFVNIYAYIYKCMYKKIDVDNGFLFIIFILGLTVWCPGHTSVDTLRIIPSEV